LHVTRQESFIPSIAHLSDVCFLATHVQSLVINLPRQGNFIRAWPSIQGLHVPQVFGHIEEIPSNLHLFNVSLFPTQKQLLVLTLPLFFLTLIRSGESLQVPDVAGADVGVITGADVGVITGDDVDTTGGNVGVITGDGVNTTTGDIEGVLVGADEGWVVSS